MAKPKFIAEHPILTTIIPIAGLIIGGLALIEPKYKWVKSGEVCGYAEETKTTRPHKWKSCENVNKIVGYRYSEIVETSSGWVSGGKDQNWHCNNVKRSKERAVGFSIQWEKLSSWEESKKDFFGHVRYKYHCKLKAKWEAVYQIERHKACGKAEPVTTPVSVPKSCYDKSKRIGWKFRWQ